MNRIDVESMLSECNRNHSKREIEKWIEWQRGVIHLLSQNLEREKSRLEEFIAVYGNTDDGDRPNISSFTKDRMAKFKMRAKPVNQGYNSKWTWKEKMLYILKCKNRLITVRDFVDVLQEIEPTYNHIPDPNNTVAVYLGRLVKARQIIRYKIPQQRAGYYAHHSWVDEQGKLKDEFRKNGFV